MKTKTKILSMMALGASLVFSQQNANGQFWHMNGNASIPPYSGILGGTPASANTNYPLRIYTYGAERMRVNANVAGKVGYVGIGTTAPNTRLHVNGVITATGGTSTAWNTAVTRVPSGTTSRVPRWSGTAYVAGSIYDNATNVGIGTTAPASKLHVQGPGLWDLSTTEGDFKVGSAAYRLKIGVALGGGGAGDCYLSADGGTSRLFLGSGNSLANTQTMAIVNGLVGIGNAVPSDKLDVMGNIRLNDNRLYLRGGTDVSHHLGYDAIFDGPRLSGYNGGILGGTGPDAAILTWTWNGFVGNVGIGTMTPAYKLDVCGTIRASEVRIETGWCDYVFANDYKLRSLSEVEDFINVHKHLPGIAPASEVESEGLKIGEMNKAMMEKIEELTLYVIQQEKKLTALQAQNDVQQKQIDTFNK